jgi:hypothetical protein
MLFSWLVAIHRGSKGNTNRLLIGKVGKVGQRMAEAAKGINPEITPAEEIMVTTEEIVAEAKEEAKEAPSRLRQQLHELQATWERASIQFFQAPKL